MSGKQERARMQAYKAWKAQADPRDVLAFQVRDHSRLIGLTPERADRRVEQALKEYDRAHGV
jgi:hypothetical protein